MRHETSVPASEIAQRVQEMNGAFGCTNVVEEFRAAYKGGRGAEEARAVAAAQTRGGCPVAPAAPANLAACPVAHGGPAARDIRRKVEPYVRLTALTADLWKAMEASRELEIVARDGGTHARLFYDGLSLEKELPHLTNGRRGPASAFRTVVSLFEGYNRLVAQKLGHEFTGEGIERTLGGFDEGLLQLAMMFDAVVQGYEERERAPIPADQLQAAMRASYTTALALMQLNYFPQKMLDELIVADINPYTAAWPSEGGVVAEVRASVWDFIRRLGEELFADPSVSLLSHDSAARVEYVLTQLHETVCGPHDRGRLLQRLMLELYKKVVDAIKAAPDAGGRLEGTPFFKQAIARLAKLRIGAPQQRYSQQDALMVLQRTRFGVDVMDLAAGYRESPENLFTVGCTALRAGIPRKWYTRFSEALVQWYRLESERHAA
jgi:hypothetical protein